MSVKTREEFLATRNKLQAARVNKKMAEECYDCIAVIMRMIDALEGRQPLGKVAEGKLSEHNTNNDRANRP